MTVADLEANMTNAEYIDWVMFDALRAQEAELEQKMAQSRGGRR
jgi:hypothetical protein